MRRFQIQCVITDLLDFLLNIRKEYRSFDFGIIQIIKSQVHGLNVKMGNKDDLHNAPNRTNSITHTKLLTDYFAMF